MDKVLDYHEKAPPKSQECDLELMARVQKMCNVGRMSAILKEFCNDHPAGLKLVDKAALLVRTVPRDRLLRILADGSQEPRHQASQTWQRTGSVQRGASS